MTFEQSMFMGEALVAGTMLIILIGLVSKGNRRSAPAPARRRPVVPPQTEITDRRAWFEAYMRRMEQADRSGSRSR